MQLDFCLIGAPKCATTSLYHYLNARSDVFIPSIKEPHYYCTDFPEYRRILSSADYRQIFRSAKKNQKLGEASVFYLYSKQALRNLLSEHPQCKIIVCVREPVGMLQSYHEQMVNSFREPEQDFINAWRLETDRRAGRTIPDHCPELSHLFYSEVAKFGEQLERVYNTISREQVLVVFHEDLINDTPTAYKRLLSFLNLQDDQPVEFRQYNRSKHHRWPTISKFIMHPPFPLNQVKAWARRAFGIHGSLLRPLYFSVLFTEHQRNTISEEFKQEIQNSYADDILKLAQLTDRDLTHWLPQQQKQVA